jgi:hypothetical protein
MDIDPKDAIDLARTAARQALAVAQQVGAPTGTDLVATGADSAVGVKAKMAEHYAKAVEAQHAALEKVAEAKTAVEVQQAELDRAMRALRAEMEPLSKQLARMQEGIWTMNLYLGRDEEIVVLRSGDPAPAGTPITVRQQVLAMDEESMIAAESGGIDVRSVEAFDAWLLERDEHLDQLLPEPRGVVAVMARRSDRDYKDPWMTAALNAENHRTWWLIRNGRQVYRMQTDFEVGRRMTPGRDEFTSMFVDQRTHQPLQPGTAAWMKAEEAAGARERHYMRVAMVLQGLVDRTQVFAPLPKTGLNLLRPEDYDAGHVVLLQDDENLLTTGRVPFRTWLRRLNARLAPGMRVMVTTGHDSWPERSRNHWDYDRHPRLSPPRAESPASGEVYTIRRRTPDGALVFTYPRTQEEWMRGPYGRGEYRVPATNASCTIFTDDPFVLPVDLADVATMRTYLNARTERHEYIAMVPLLRAAITFKEREAAAEAPFRALLAARVAAAEGLDVDEAAVLVDPVIGTWKVGARWFRPLQAPVVGEDGHDLQVKNMVRRPKPKSDADRPGVFLPNGAAAKARLNRAIHASAWSMFLQRLQDKTDACPEDVRPVLVRVDPRNTSRTCAACGHCAPGNRESQAVFRCEACGHQAHADTNAAANILARGRSSIEPQDVRGSDASASFASRVNHLVAA